METRTRAGEDVLDVRDLIARFEEIEETDDEDEKRERDTLRALLADLEGKGGDEEWRDVWYPITLIRDSYFKDYAQELAEDIGAINPDAAWPANCIDWEQAARELQMDYTTVEYEGVTYWCR